MSLKNLIVLTCFLLISQVTNASSRTIGIYDLEITDSYSRDIVVFTMNGQVYEFNDVSELNFLQLKLAKEHKERVTVEIAKTSHVEDAVGLRNSIIEIKRITPVKIFSNKIKNRLKKQYSPAMIENDYVTNFVNSDKLDALFKKLRNNHTEDSQCYNRAHIWSYEMRRYSEGGRRVQPGKMWLFFTRRYVLEYKFKWWFHVAPYVTLRGEDTVLDRKYLKAPIDLRGWTDFFIKPLTECPFIQRYSTFENNPSNGRDNCFVMKTSVHYYQPYQMELLEKGKNPEQKKWEDWELKQAYKDGLNTSHYPRL